MIVRFLGLVLVVFPMYLCWYRLKDRHINNNTSGTNEKCTVNYCK
jgi:hypothetical protein